MNWGFGVSKHEDDDTKSGERGTDTRRKSRRTTFAGRRLFIFGALVVAAATLGPIAAFATHTTPNFPQLPLESPLTDTAKNPGLELDCASGSDISAVGTIL